MKIKAVAKELKNADVRFISLVKRGANRIPFRILKADKGETQMLDLSTLGHVLKNDKPHTLTKTPAKKAHSPGFAAILGASVSRDIGTPPPPVKIAPAPTVKPFPAQRDTPAPSVGKPLPQAFNTPKEPLRAERGNAVEFKDLQAAIDSALSKRRDEDKAAAFNASRSAFSRIHKSTAPDARSGTGNAHALRNLGGRMAAAILGSNTRKDEGHSLPTNTAFRPISGASLKG